MLVTFLKDNGAHGGYNIYFDKFNLIYALSMWEFYGESDGLWDLAVKGNDIFPYNKNKEGLEQFYVEKSHLS